MIVKNCVTTKEEKMLMMQWEQGYPDSERLQELLLKLDALHFVDVPSDARGLQYKTGHLEEHHQIIRRKLQVLQFLCNWKIYLSSQTVEIMTLAFEYSKRCLFCLPEVPITHSTNSAFEDRRLPASFCEATRVKLILLCCDASHMSAVNLLQGTFLGRNDKNVPGKMQGIQQAKCSNCYAFPALFLRVLQPLLVWA